MAGNAGFETEVMGPDVNPIHFLIPYIPRQDIPQMVSRLKQGSTRQLGLLHRGLYTGSIGTGIYPGAMGSLFVQ